MSDSFISNSTIYTTLIVLIVAFAVTKVASFFGVDPEVYMTYVYFYFIIYLAYLILPHQVPEL
jgi:hypothetical protein|tara:strand:+ start:212 stop:400 length:189 start_codon:yes stop_codon:yes gene_type:complete